MVYAQPSTYPGEWHTQTPMGLWHADRSPNLGQKTRSYCNQQKKKKEILQNCRLCCTTDQRSKLKESEKKDKLLGLAREVKKTMEHGGDVFGTVTNRLLKGLEDLEVGGWVGRSKLQHHWERPEYWEESWRLEETCCHSNSCQRPTANTDEKNSLGVN